MKYAMVAFLGLSFVLGSAAIGLTSAGSSIRALTALESEVVTGKANCDGYLLSQQSDCAGGMTDSCCKDQEEDICYLNGEASRQVAGDCDMGSYCTNVVQPGMKNCCMSGSTSGHCSDRKWYSRPCWWGVTCTAGCTAYGVLVEHNCTGDAVINIPNTDCDPV